MSKKITRKSKKKTKPLIRKTRKSLPTILPVKEQLQDRPVVQAEIPLVSDAVGEEMVLSSEQLNVVPKLTEAEDLVERKFDEISESDRFGFDIASSFMGSIDAQIRAAREHLNRLTAIKHEFQPGFIRRLLRRLRRRK